MLHPQKRVSVAGPHLTGASAHRASSAAERSQQGSCVTHVMTRHAMPQHDTTGHDATRRDTTRRDTHDTIQHDRA